MKHYTTLLMQAQIKSRNTISTLTPDFNINLPAPLIKEKVQTMCLDNNSQTEKGKTMSTTQKLSENKMPLSIGFVLGSVSTLITSNPTVKALVYQQMKALFPHLDNSQLNDNLSQCSSYLQTIAKTLEEMSTKKSYDL